MTLVYQIDYLLFLQEIKIMRKFTVLLFAFVCVGIGKVTGQYSILINFNDSIIPQGTSPNGSLTLLGNKLYGITSDITSNFPGNIFSVDTNGFGYSNLYDFNDTTGDYPAGEALTLFGNKFYGMTNLGGTQGVGVIFSIDTNGRGYKVLLNFNDTNGGNPTGSLIYSGGTLYGKTGQGGTKDDGVCFSIDTSGSGYKDLLNFNDTNGFYAYGTLTRSGNRLFGTTEQGGPYIYYGCIFSINTDGSGYKNLFYFNDTNGALPVSLLTLSGGVLYGMTKGGGLNHDGVFFSIDTNGNGYKKLLDFNGTNGEAPWGALILSGSVLYGMTSAGGAYNYGLVFSIDTNGTGYKALFDFNGPNGAYPYGNLTLSGNELYGMTHAGGTNNGGVVFRLNYVTAGINKLTSDLNVITIFPNPSIGIFTITNVGAQNFVPEKIEVFNVLGEQVLKQIPVRTVHPGGLRSSQPARTGTGGDDKVIDLTMQPNGIYFYRVVAEDGSIAGEGKLVIQK